MEDIETGDDDPIFSCEFKGQEAYGFDFKAEDGESCCFICAGVEKGAENKLLTVLISASNEEELESLIAFTEEYISFE